MRCKKCDYRLWNLPSRRCPECGTPFRPSEFEFVPNSVRFCCPHCSQAYFGTSPKGHLIPSTAFTCVACGRPVHMDDMVLQPAEGFSEEQTVPRHVPWLERDRHGFWRAWFRTIGMAMVAPGQLMQSLPRYPNAPMGGQSHTHRPDQPAVHLVGLSHHHGVDIRLADSGVL